MSAKESSLPAKLGTPIDAGPRQWVQTSREAHEAWGRMINSKPRAAALLHHLIASMGSRNIVVVSQKTLAKLMGCSVDTVQRATAVLVQERWIQTVRLNGPGTVLAFAINSRVAWGEKRDHLHLASFTAEVLVDAADQPAETLERQELRRIPVLYAGEQLLPAGDGEPPPSEPALPGFEADLPGIEGE